MKTGVFQLRANGGQITLQSAAEVQAVAIDDDFKTYDPQPRL